MTLPELNGDLKRLLEPLERTALVLVARHGGDVLEAWETICAMATDMDGKPTALPVTELTYRGAGGRGTSDKAGSPILVKGVAGIRPPTWARFSESYASALRKVEGAVERRRRAAAATVPPAVPPGKSVTLPRDRYPTAEEAVMSAPEHLPGAEDREPVPAEGFADRIEREARQESTRVLEELVRLRFDAHQVVRVLRALNLDVPEELDALVAGRPAPAADLAAAEQEAHRVAAERDALRSANEGLSRELDEARTRLEGAEAALRVAMPEPSAAPAKPDEAGEQGPPTPPPAPAAETGAKPAEAEGERRTYTTKDGATRRVPTIPGIEAVPERLRGMPAAQKGGPVPQRIATAEAQQDVYEALADGDQTAIELSKATDMSANRVSDYLRDLSAAGLVRLAGDQRKNAPVFTRREDGIVVTDEPEGRLGEMPAMRTDMGLAMKLTVAALQLRVVETAERLGETFVIGEFEEHFPGMPRVRVQDAVNVLAEDGTYLRRTGHMRRAAGQTAGRTAFEYVAVSPARREGERELPPPVQASEVAVEPEVLAKVRDWAREKPDGEVWSVLEAAEGTLLQKEVVLAALRQLQEREVVSDESPTPDLQLFAYRKPTEAGRAAEMDAARRREAAAANKNGNGADAVAGTGGPLRVSHKPTQKVLDACRAAGASLERVGSGHIAIVNPANGRRVIVGSTEGSSGNAKTKKRLAAIGITI